MLLELAVGDAYGAGFEYADAERVWRHNDLSQYLRHRTGEPTALGRYTDDTQMSLAIAEALISDEAWTPLNLASRFVDVFHRDQREGYAGGFQTFLERTCSGEAFVQNIRPDSDKSGAAMRACPVGVLPTVAQVLDRTRTQAKLTHDTPEGIAAAQAAALMTHYFLYGYGVKSDLGAFLDTYVPGGYWSISYRGKVYAKGWMSVRAAITAVRTHDRMSDILRACVEFTGDVDTVATVALAAASCSREVEQDLPEELIERLENGPYGRDYLRKLDQQLLALVKNNS